MGRDQSQVRFLLDYISMPKGTSTSTTSDFLKSYQLHNNIDDVRSDWMHAKSIGIHKIYGTLDMNQHVSITNIWDIIKLL